MVIRGINQNSGSGRGSGTSPDDADLIVRQPDVLNLGVSRGQCLPERAIQGVYRPVAFGHHIDVLICPPQFYGRFAGLVLVPDRSDIGTMVLQQFPEGLERAPYPAG